MPGAESSSSCSAISAKASASASCCVSEPGRARYSESGGCLFELKSRQVHDDPRLAPCDSHEGSRYVRGVCSIKLPYNATTT